MVLALWIGGAWAGKWEGENPDIRAERVIAATPAQLSVVLTDLEQVRRLWSAACVGVWEEVPGAAKAGKGAQIEARYDMAAMHRTLVMTVSAIAVNYIDHDHPGKKGFTTRYVFTDLSAGGAPSTRVEMKTPIYAPKWPLTSYYYRAVKPEWEACQAEVLEALAGAVGG